MPMRLNIDSMSALLSHFSLMTSTSRAQQTRPREGVEPLAFMDCPSPIPRRDLTVKPLKPKRLVMFLIGCATAVSILAPIRTSAATVTATFLPRAFSVGDFEISFAGASGSGPGFGCGLATTLATRNLVLTVGQTFFLELSPTTITNVCEVYSVITLTGDYCWYGIQLYPDDNDIKISFIRDVDKYQEDGTDKYGNPFGHWPVTVVLKPSAPTISLSSSLLAADGTSTVTAFVSDSNQFPAGITWSLVPANALGCAINSSGVITAGTQLGVITVRASKTDIPNCYIETTLELGAPCFSPDNPKVVFNPEKLQADNLSQSKASVTIPGLFSGGIVWSITSSDTLGCTIDSSGIVTAGTNQGTITVRAAKATNLTCYTEGKLSLFSCATCASECAIGAGLVQNKCVDVQIDRKST